MAKASNHRGIPAQIAESWASGYLMKSVLNHQLIHFSPPEAYAGTLCGINSNLYDRGVTANGSPYNVCGECVKLANVSRELKKIAQEHDVKVLTGRAPTPAKPEAIVLLSGGPNKPIDPVKVVMHKKRNEETAPQEREVLEAVEELRRYVRDDYYGQLTSAVESVGGLKRIRRILGLPELPALDPGMHELQEKEG